MKLFSLRYTILAAFLFSLLSCAHRAQTQAPPSMNHALAPKHKLGELDGKAIYESELSHHIQRRLDDIENELAQRRMHLTWIGLEEFIDRALLEQAAQDEGISTEELLENNTKALLKAPNENEIRRIYNLNRERLGVSYEQAEPLLRKRLLQQEQKELEGSFLASLRKNKTIDYQFEIPNLPRISMNHGQSPSSGPEDAPITLVEFSDFECPYCARAKRLIDELQDIYPTQLRVIFRDFPLDQHPRATPAAIAAHCAHQQGKFWEYHDLLFANPHSLEDADFEKYADELGLNQTTFKQCQESSQVTEKIAKNKMEAIQYGVKGTPAIYINGMKLIGLLPLPLIRAIIDKELGE